MTRAAIAVDAPATRDAAVVIAEAGGSAVDITVAAALAATLSEALLCSLGGSGFLMVQRPGRAAELIDGADVVPSGPRQAACSWQVELPYGDGVQLRAGPASVAVPGLLACLHTAWQRHGRLPWAELVAPALELARRGCPLGATTARWLALAALPLLARQPASRACFCRRDPVSGALRPLRQGEQLRLPGMAASLELIARQGAAALYGGELGEAWSQYLQARGGLVTRLDLARHRAVVRRPLQHRFAGFSLALNPPPARGGLALRRLLQAIEPGAEGGAMPGAAAPGQPLLDPLEALRRQIAAQLELRLWSAGLGVAASASTTQISVVTADGEAASLTLSNGYGAGITIPGTGIACNNSLGEPELNPGGFLRAPAGSRLPSNMSPCVASHGDGRLLALGSPGASRIPTALAQVWWQLAGAGQPPAQAIAAPRLHVGSGPDGAPLLLHEPGALDPLQPLTPERLRRFGLETVAQQAFAAPDMYFGGIKLAGRMADGALIALADPRRQGSVALTD